MSVDPNEDLIINVIHGGIRRGIEVTIDNGCFGSAASVPPRFIGAALWWDS